MKGGRKVFQQFDRNRYRDRDRDFDRDRDRDRDRNRRRDRDFRKGTPFDFFRFLLPITPFSPFTPQRPSDSPPPGPPPSFIPRQPIGPFAVDPGAISNCRFRFTYIWPFRMIPFWFFPTFVGPRSIAGFRWTGSNWVYFGIDLREIQAFQCF